MPYTARQEISP